MAFTSLSFQQQPNFDHGVPLTETVQRPRIEQAAPAEVSPPPPRRAALIGLIAAGAAVVAIAIAVVVSLNLVGVNTRSDGPPADSTEGSSDDGGAVIETLDAPTLESAVVSADRTGVTFVWEYQDFEDGDMYIWSQRGTVDESVTPTTEPTATVTGLLPGEEVCIVVNLVRDGKESAPLESCATT